MQETTLELGRTLFNTGYGTGVQDAITPKWQTRNNLIMFAGIVIYLIICIEQFVWYIGGLLFLVTFFIGIPVAARFFVPRPMSRHYIKRIHKDLKRRQSDFIAAGDKLRAGAVQELLDRFPQLA
jgi:hypothetical protein